MTSDETGQHPDRGLAHELLHIGHPVSGATQRLYKQEAIRRVDQPVFLHTVPLIDGPFRHLSIIRLRG
jgi:hypothetical protein